MTKPAVLRMMELARRSSFKSDYPRCRIGAVVFRRNQVLGYGYNQRKTHPKSPNEYKFLHAEVNAMLGIPLTDLRGASICVYRERLDGMMGMSKPCPTCHEYLRGHGITMAYYTSEDGIKEMAL